MNLVKGTVFTAKLAIFGKYNARTKQAKFLGEVQIKAKVTNESYGLTTAQHTFTFEILESSDISEFQIGCKYKRKGRNLYPYLIEICEQPENLQDLENEKRARKEDAKDYAKYLKDL